MISASFLYATTLKGQTHFMFSSAKRGMREPLEIINIEIQQVRGFQRL